MLSPFYGLEMLEFELKLINTFNLYSIVCCLVDDHNHLIFYQINFSGYFWYILER